MDADFSAKFCNVVPIRYGLITWAFMKVCAALGAIAYILLAMYTMFIQHGIPPNRLFGTMVTLEIAIMLDLCMSVTLIVGEYGKNYKLITVYFRYAIFAVISAILVISLYTTYELALLWAEVDNAPWRDLRTFDLPGVVKLATIGTIYVRKYEETDIRVMGMMTVFEVYIVYLLRIETYALRDQWKIKCMDSHSLAESYVDVE